MTKSRLNYWIDIGLLLTFISTFSTGIIKFPGFLRFFGISPRHLPMDLLMFIHDWGGVGIGVFSLLHVILHWKWMVKMTTNMFPKSEKKSKKSEETA